MVNAEIIVNIPIKGNVNDNNDDDEEWDDNIKEYQLISTAISDKSNGCIFFKS